MPMQKKSSAIEKLLEIMARLRGPEGCPWDREQDHQSLRFHAVEEVYELIDAIESNDDHEMEEELGDLLLQVVFHCQLAGERGAFDFEAVAARIAEKLIRRHPHVFGDKKVSSVDAVWTQWEQIKRQEKEGTRHERPSRLDGIPRHLPALARAEKLVKKARQSGLIGRVSPCPAGLPRITRRHLARHLFELTAFAQSKGWKTEELLREEIDRQEQALKTREQAVKS